MSEPVKVEVVYPTQRRPGAPDPPTFNSFSGVTMPTLMPGEARAIIEELLRTDGWRSARSGSEKSQAYIRARRNAIAFLAGKRPSWKHDKGSRS